MSDQTLQPPSRVALVSLGCPKNLIDSEKMLGLLASDGLIPTDSHDEAEAIIINTCGFLEAAKEESLEVIREAAARKRSGRLRRLIVAGCLVQRHRAKLLEWCPEIDALVGVFDRDRIVAAVRGAQSERQAGPLAEAGDGGDTPSYWVATNALAAARDRGMAVTGLTVNGKNGRGIGYFESDAARLRLTPRHYAYLRLSEGCNQNCAFCAIPGIRGKMRSKPVEAIIAEARELMADGAFELNLIGQDTTSFGSDIGYKPGLSGILTELDKVAQEHGGGWLRLMYAYPSCFTDEMIDTLAGLGHVVKYVDMPLQHINDRILTAMRRNTSRQLIETLLDKLRDRVEGVAIRTTLITGFPGETEREHRELVEFVESFGFDMLGVFQFSAEPGTSAARLEDDPNLLVPAEVKQARYDELMSIQQRIAFEQAQYLACQYPGKRAEDRGRSGGLQFDVLIDSVAVEGANGSTANHAYVGRCYHQAPQVDSVTAVRSRASLSLGELVRCTIVGADGYDLIAEPTAELERCVNLHVL